MAITELFDQLEKAVADAQEKQETLATATAAQLSAQNNYNIAVTTVEKLKTELHNTIGNIFPPERVRQTV